jgi:tetratricopeptide (TPR) repeat protein
MKNLPHQRYSLLLLILLLGFQTAVIQGESPGKKPSIDAQSYAVEAELMPSTHQIKAKASIKFTVLEEMLNRLDLQFNTNLKIEKIYLAGNIAAEPGTQGAAQASVGASKPESDPSYLSRTIKKTTPASKAKSAAPRTPPPVELLQFHQYAEDSSLMVDLDNTLRKGDTATLVVEYAGALESAENSPLEGIQTAYIGEEMTYLLAVSRWFPTHRYMEDRAMGSFRITVPEGYVVAMGGTAKDKEQAAGKETYVFNVEQATFSGSLAVAKFTLVTAQAGPIQVSFYVKDAKRDFVNPQAEVIGKIAELFAEKFGLFPYRTLKIVVIDNNSLVGYSAPGIQFLADRAFENTPDANLLGRELSYQYWQSSITPKTPMDLWLKEGFAAFSALLYQEKISSEAGFALTLRETAISALTHEDKSSIRNAYQLAPFSAEYNSILKGKGAYVLFMLRGVLGDENFSKLLKQYVYDYGNSAASIEDFKALAEKISGQNLTYFFAQWIDQVGVPKFESSYTTLRTRQGFKVIGTIKQDLDTFRTPMEIQVETDGKPEIKQIEVVGTESSFSVDTFGKPIRVKLDPNHKILGITTDMTVDVQIARGDELRKFGQPTEAIVEYQKAIELKKRSSLAFFRMGEVFLDQRSYQSASNSFREALNGDLEPKWIEVWAHINLGKVYDVLGQRERALREYQQALDTNDNSQGAQELARKLIQTPYQYEGQQILIK